MGKELRQRQKNRLPNYDYSQPGCYFITVCTYNREKFFWTCTPVGADIIRPSHQTLSQYGVIVEQAILAIPCHYTGVAVDEYVIMPNHVHMILTLPQVCGRMISAPTKSVSTIIGQMKRVASKRCGVPFWQKGFYDHIIRSEADYLHTLQPTPPNGRRTFTTPCPKERQCYDDPPIPKNPG